MFFSKEEFKTVYNREIVETFSHPLSECSPLEKFETLAAVVSGIASSIRTETSLRHQRERQKKIYYFSMEFLLGQLLENYLINLGIRDVVAEGLADLGEDLDSLCAIEPDPGLGNGGLGRLAACFLDSMAALGVPGVGMGLRYRFGLFRQRIADGYQIAEADPWLENGWPWELAKPDEAVPVRFGGYVERQYNNGVMTFRHVGYQTVNAVPYDVPIVGYGGKDVNVLHLWNAQPTHESVDMEAFNRGDYALARKEQSDIEAITCILYPDDSTHAGKELRLKQEYFLVAAGIGSILRTYKKQYGTDWVHLPELISIHTNDTHPALCAPELLRVLIDEEGLSWDEAWDVTRRTLSFTNHTVMPEALETWSIDLMRRLLPRVYMMVEEIDRRWREHLTGDGTMTNLHEVLEKTAILWDGQARMANLSVICSHSVNGVAALHTEILKAQVFQDFAKLNPEKFNNKTNGVSHRRFLIQANPPLTRLLCEAIGDGWMTNPAELERLSAFRSDAGFLSDFRRVKRQGKERLCRYVRETSGLILDPDSVFDVQVKRIHAYKRQLLNAFKVLDLYNALKDDPNLPIENYTFLFSGKAAQGYTYAREIIKFINSVAELVNSDPVVSQRIKVVFIENFCVSNAQLIYPAADISEQISTAGKEASGTGNMKFMMNGAITLGTLDGANVEISQRVGSENIRIFGLNAEEVMGYYLHGGYSSRQVIDTDPRLKRITDQLVNGFFRSSGCDFWGIYDSLVSNNDEYFVLRDFASYVSTWRALDAEHRNEISWSGMGVMNIARSGAFSSDRTISEYARDIWNIPVDR